MQPDHPGRPGLRDRDDRSVPDQRPALLRAAPDADPRRVPLRERRRVLRGAPPYLWSASFPSYDPFVRSYIQVLGEQGWFEGEATIGVVAAESEINHRAVDDVATRCSRTTASTPEVAWVDTTDTGTLFRAHAGRGHLPQQGHRPGHVPRRLPAGVGLRHRRRPQDGFTPDYAISSFDNPSFFVNNPDTIPPDTMNGMVGIGFHPPQDVPDSVYPFPTGEAETECVDIYADGRDHFETRENARVALPYCDAARLLKLGADGSASGNLNAAAWAKAIDPRRQRVPHRVRVPRRAGRRPARRRGRLPGAALRRGLRLLRVRGRGVAASMTSEAPALSCAGIRASYGPVQVLFDAGLTVGAGRDGRAARPQRRRQDHAAEVIGGLLKPAPGTVTLGGDDITRRRDPQAGRARALPGRRAGRVPLADRRREPAMHGYAQRRQALDPRRRRGRARGLPAPARAPQPAGVHPLRRRAADARARQGDRGRAEGARHRRVLARPRAGRRRRAAGDGPPAQRARHRGPRSSSSRSTSRSRSSTASTSWRRARSSPRTRRPSWPPTRTWCGR